MTSCEAILQLPYYNNSVHWLVYLVEMKPDHCFLLLGQQQNFPLDLSKNWTRWLYFIIYHLAFPDTPSCTGSPGVQCRNTEFFCWGIKRKIKALGIRNLQCSFSSGSPGESKGESSSNTIMTFTEKETEQMVKMVKMLTSDLRISFWESHYPPLVVLASSALTFFLLSQKVHSPRLRFSNILNFKTLWNVYVEVFNVCGCFRKSLMTFSSIGFGGHRFFSGFWPFQYKRNSSAKRG